jgi:hypothetical protein
MIRHFLKAVAFASAVMFVVPTFAGAAEMTCTATDDNGCITAKGGDGKETKVKAPGAKVGDKMNCDDKGTCTKKLMQ